MQRPPIVGLLLLAAFLASPCVASGSDSDAQYGGAEPGTQLHHTQLLSIEPLGASAIASNEGCDTCLWVVNQTELFLNNTETKRTIIDFMVNQVCPVLPGDLQMQCETLSAVMVPQIITWLEATLDPKTACADVGFCPPSHGALLVQDLQGFKMQQMQQRAPQLAQSWQDLACPACEFVLQAAMQQLTDPDLQDLVVRVMQTGCVLVPEEDRADCKTRVQDIVDQAAKLAAEVEPHHACAVAGACPATAEGLGMGAKGLEGFGQGPDAAALAAVAVATARAAAVVRAKVADMGIRVARELQQGVGEVRGASCEICQIVVIEAAALVADPDTQSSITAAAMSACGLTGNWRDQCSSYVDMYLPVAFNLALAYLKPDPMCHSLGMCDAAAIQLPAMAQAGLQAAAA